MNESNQQTEIDNSKLEELLKEMDKGLVEGEKKEKFLELLKKSQLLMPVIFSNNMNEEVENFNVGKAFIPKEQIGFKINYIKLKGDEKAVPLFTSDELMKSINLQSSSFALYMEDLASMLKQTDKYSFVSINPFTNLEAGMPLSSFLNLFKETDVEKEH